MGTVPASRRGLNAMKQNLIERLGVRRERKLPPYGGIEGYVKHQLEEANRGT
jgi:hypothetical protein